MIEQKRVINPPEQISLKHILKLTDDTGIFQDASGTQADKVFGYSLNDNARALLLCLWMSEKNKDPKIAMLIKIYFGFVKMMALEDGSFMSYLPDDFSSDSDSSSDSYDEDFEENEDAFGRTFWALAVLYLNGPVELREESLSYLNESVKHILRVKTPRGMANILIGLTLLQLESVQIQDAGGMPLQLVQKIQSCFKQQSEENINWFDPIVSTENGIIPYSLLLANKILKSKHILVTIDQSVNYLESFCFAKKTINPLGSKAWYLKDGELTEFTQQAIEVFSLLLMYKELYRQKKNKSYLEKLNICFDWFLGENNLGIPLFDKETGGCWDGLEEESHSPNQGAESLISFWLSHHIYFSNGTN